MSSETATTWSAYLDVFEETITRAEKALVTDEWPSDGWSDATSDAVPGEDPKDGEITRYRELQIRADRIVEKMRQKMGSIQSELGQHGRRMDAVRGYSRSESFRS